MTQWLGTVGAALGALGVAMGAFGAHGLRDRVEPRLLQVWDTAASYQLWHALAIVAVALLLRRHDLGAARVAGWSFLVGVMLFSGSLYVLVLTGKGWLGAITPLGGTAFIVGWIALARALWISGSQ